MDASEEKKIKKSPLLLSLVVTESCNLDCAYCFVKNKSERQMPGPVAIAAVERYLNSASSKFDQLQVDFTGGEPLANFPLIRKVVDYVLTKKWRKNFSFSIGTNGTLITPEIRRWSDTHPCVNFALSFDGIEEAHNKNRSNSYAAVVKNIDFFKKWPDNKIKMTISPYSVGKIAKSVKHAHRLGMGIAANVVFENAWKDKKQRYLKIFDRQLSELIDFYLANPELEPPYLVNIPLEALIRPRLKHERFCGSGRNMVTVDVQGVEYPCHRFLPMSSDNPDPHPRLSFRKVRPEKCDRCVLLSLCPSCIAYNYECHSDVDYRTTYHCEFIYLQAMASAKLQYLKLKRDIQNNPPKVCDAAKGAGIKRMIDSILLLMGSRILKELSLGIISQ